VWDIGLTGSSPQDEYDGHLGEVYELLLRGPREKEMADHLGSTVEDGMSLHSQSDATERTVLRGHGAHGGTFEDADWRGGGQNGT
jgi:hypothetical protein